MLSSARISRTFSAALAVRPTGAPGASSGAGAASGWVEGAMLSGETDIGGLLLLKCSQPGGGWLARRQPDGAAGCRVIGTQRRLIPRPLRARPNGRWRALQGT